MTTTQRRRRALRCLECGASMRTRLATHHYTEAGLPDVTLVNVPVSECPRCHKRAVSIPRLEELHRSIASALAEKPARLTPQEVRFLRKWLGFSGVDFAAVMGKTPETVSRWERADAPMAMDPAAERLLRLMVLTREPVSSYPLERLGEMASAPAQASRLRLARKRGARWAPEVAAGA